MPGFTAPSANQPLGFALTVPDHWVRFDVSDAPLAGARRAALAKARNQRERAQLDDLFRQARAVNQAARRRGALWGAATATRYDDGVLFLGYVMVFAIDPGDDVDLSPATLAKQLTRDGVQDDSAWPRSVRPVSLAAAGEAVRIVGTERVRITADVIVDMLAMHTLVPVPAGDSARLLVTCCSPNLPLRDEVFELFDAISGTFRFTTTGAVAIGQATH